MSRSRQVPTRGAALRAAALATLAVAAAALTWRLRPTPSIGSGSPDSAIVTGCGWLAWALAAYVAIAVAAASLAHLLGRCRLAADVLARLAPARVRRLVEATVTLSVAVSLVGGTASAGAAAPGQAVATTRSGSSVAGSALDWPGLTTSASRGVSPPAHAQPSTDRHMVVRPGDTLWAIAAKALGPGASDRDITIAWHAWYAANRSMIGPNPSLIRPGQRLVPPAHNRPTR